VRCPEGNEQRGQQETGQGNEAGAIAQRPRALSAGSDLYGT
jgi:hypothetical protein